MNYGPNNYSNAKYNSYSSIDTRVPPMNISGKKSLYQEKSVPYIERSLSRQISSTHPINISPQKVLIRNPPPLLNSYPIISPSNHFCTSYSKQFPVLPPPMNPFIQLNPFQVCENLLLEDNRPFIPDRNRMNSEIVNEHIDLFSKKKIKKEKKKITEEKVNFYENIPTVPNEDKGDPNIKTENYVVSPHLKNNHLGKMNNYFYEIHNDTNEWNFDNNKGNKSDLDKKNKRIIDIERKQRFLKNIINEIDDIILKNYQKDEERNLKYKNY